LKFKTGPLAGKSYSLGPGEYFFIGSGENCAVRIVDDPEVEPSHAALFYDPNGRLLFKDMGTKAGSSINGKKISKSTPLSAGDRVTIGQFSTFQSSWWNALQATRLTRFSNIKMGGPSLTDPRSPRQKTIQLALILAIAAGSGLTAYQKFGQQDGLTIVLDGDSGDEASNSRGQRTPAGRDQGIFAGVLSSKLFRDKAKRPGKARIELTPERKFIWDEIVAISRRFGDPPPSAMDPGFVREVERHIDIFTKHNQHQVLLNRKHEFSAAIERTLVAKGLPPELGYIVWVESNYKVDAKSSVGALGLWQFMPETGAEYGLKIGGPLDERKDPDKATEAAADYFISLLRMFGTERYLLAIASYNSGQNRIKRFQIASTVHKEHSSDFWQIRFALPKETAEYVPKVIAAIIIGRNPARYSISH
ncbi:MAG: transglycosylase SLT domain-containing protein, partial [Proteobacteria bacterium]|nr:transglycosylase SLT domain-containing protein [Pseudomonadota bacterium]